MGALAGARRDHESWAETCEPPPQGPLRKKLLVLATPRSGSRFLTKVLRNVGVKVGHEAFKRDGTIGMFFAVEDVWYPGKHWEMPMEGAHRRSWYEFEQVWHLVRDPRDAIPSIASDHLPGTIWVWQERHTGISCGLYPKILRAMLFWVAWNELIEKHEKIDFFLRAEDTETRWPEIRRQLALEDAETETMPPIPTDYGHVDAGPRGHARLSFDAMREIAPGPAERVVELARRYGYEETP